METILKEFRFWKTENYPFYRELKEHGSLLFDRFYPVFAVMDFIEQETSAKRMRPDSDLTKIFDVGLAFLHDQFESCKIYLKTNFNDDLHAFLEYDRIINYILFIEDVRYELEEKHRKYDNKTLEKLLDKLEDIIDKKMLTDDNLALYVDEQIRLVTEENKLDFYGIIDIFSDVADTLGLTLYEDEDIVIGKDI
ncbi:MAG: hypothetical protein PHD24_05505 [Candidatus Izemoplasmatales bacterium]|nr:hypothetical protein [Candidatus Izemoplasmatales bacterium]MDD4595973.1 hypothetical protein [Candidatus Izemoplasmatales bacterium]